MVTGEVKNKIDNIWNTFWTGGITNSITVLEQMTYLFFMKMLDDAQTKKEVAANAFGVEISNPVFKRERGIILIQTRRYLMSRCGGMFLRMPTLRTCSIPSVTMFFRSSRR